MGSKHGSLMDNSSLFNDQSLFATDTVKEVSKVEVENDTYKILVNVQNYKPEELVIKTINNTVQVEAKHEENASNGHSYSTQSFNQSFTLPPGVDLECVSSALSKQGVLTISAPLPKVGKQSESGRPIPIKHM